MTNVIEVEGNRFRLQVQVQPRSSSTGWGDLVDRERIRLKTTSPPVDGAANKACIKFIAKEFKTAKSLVGIVKGEKSRYKTFLVENYDQKRLKEFMKRLTPS
ncbi:MAG: DUF167 domain-containing protein [Proteobacteria bacterium]|nr:DUF167 domain-containing protein [Pseudomonadota bacterium]